MIFVVNVIFWAFEYGDVAYRLLDLQTYIAKVLLFLFIMAKISYKPPFITNCNGVMELSLLRLHEIFSGKAKT